MKKYVCIIVLSVFALISVAAPVLAKDAWHQFSASEAQASTLGKDKLKPSIKLFMKGQKHAKVLKKAGAKEVWGLVLARG